MWKHHHAELRDPAQIAAQWQNASETDPKLLKYSTRGKWWETLYNCGITLLVTREYEHLVVGLRAAGDSPAATFMRLPHPSGLTVDRKRGVVHIASTRNPNQVFDFQPIGSLIHQDKRDKKTLNSRPLVPIRTRFLPGCLYLHDLAMIGDELHANAVGQNAIVRLPDTGLYERVWWPRCIETSNGPVFWQNHLQLNSIAAGPDLDLSFFSASTDSISSRRPGHKNFPVDQRGVLFSGKTREVIARGLTRPHSARFHQNRVWVDDSGYGAVGYVEDGKFRRMIRLPGWTRGLCFFQNVMFVGTSRVIPRFRQYAPGLKVDESLCGVHAIDVETGRTLGSIFWPYGNQIFGIDWVPFQFAGGFPFQYSSGRSKKSVRRLFYAFDTNKPQEKNHGRH
jgi:uncharacterized protein (TIGR03032 family)